MKRLSRVSSFRKFRLSILIFALSVSSGGYFLYTGFPKQQISFEPDGGIITMGDFEAKVSLKLEQNGQDYSQYGHLPVNIAKLVVSYDSYPINIIPVFPTTIGNDSGKVMKFLIESLIVISQENTIIDVLTNQLEVNETNFLQDQTINIIWEPPMPSISGFSPEIVENYDISHGFKLGFVYENGSESYGVISSPNINFDHENLEWTYSIGRRLGLKIIWKNNNYTFSLSSIAFIGLVFSLVIAIRNEKKKIIE